MSADDHAETGSLDPRLLAALADPATWADPPSTLEDRVVAAIGSEATLGGPDVAAVHSRRTRSTALRPALLGAAAAIVVLFGAVVVLSAVDGSRVADRVSAELVPTGAIADVSGRVEVSSSESGIRIDLDALGLPRRDDGDYYEGWLEAADGTVVPVGTFQQGDGVVLWAGVDLAAVRGFTITAERAAAADSIEQGASGDVVLKADLDVGG